MRDKNVREKDALEKGVEDEILENSGRTNNKCENKVLSLLITSRETF